MKPLEYTRHWIVAFSVNGILQSYLASDRGDETTYRNNARRWNTQSEAEAHANTAAKNLPNGARVDIIPED